MGMQRLLQVAVLSGLACSLLTIGFLVKAGLILKVETVFQNGHYSGGIHPLDITPKVDFGTQGEYFA